MDRMDGCHRSFWIEHRTHWIDWFNWTHWINWTYWYNWAYRRKYRTYWIYGIYRTSGHSYEYGCNRSNWT